MAATESGARATQAAPAAVDLRRLIPELGLREYWYPAIEDKRVGWKKPVMLKMLGDDLCLFRGKSGQVAALTNACPHRGAFLGRGDCTFRGTVTCFYHGFTFDEQGECVAAIGEGPESPMPGLIRARKYPTVTLKGIVFVWMGDGEPAPLEESIPEEFFDDALVLTWTTEWPCNWRPSLENVSDSHFRYLHRNAVRVLMRPLSPPALPLRGRPTPIGTHRLRAVGQRDDAPAATRYSPGAQRPGAYQDYFPGVDAKWPQHRYRLLWTWMFAWAERRRFRRPYQLSTAWGGGQHLPGMFRQNYWTNVFTRWVVPVDKDRTRLFYFHAAKPANWLGRAYERAHFALFRNWMMNKNFSEQDARGAIEAYYDTPENLAPSDIQTVAWRKFLLTARGMERARRIAAGEVAPDLLQQPAAQEPLPADAAARQAAPVVGA